MARGELTPQEIENRKKISANINKLIKEKNVSQVDIHNHTKIPKSTLTGYVKGTSTPLKKLLLLLKLLNISDLSWTNTKMNCVLPFRRCVFYDI